MPDLDMKILVVDDFATMRRIIKNILRQLGYKNIHDADDGDVGLARLKDQPFDFIISDWNMPEMSGLELLKAVRSDEQLAEILFLMVIAEAQKENVIEAVKAKVSNHIIKPFTAETLAENMKNPAASCRVLNPHKEE